MAPKKGEKEKNQNIQVMVRCRPLNADERKKGGYSVVDLHTDRKEISVKERMVPTANSKTFAFDKVFDGKAKQIDVYKSVCSPLIEEVLTGYNCTVFAYGQTGTGKTYTMEGDRSDDPSISWENDPQAGLIPRAMHQLFARLARQPDCEFSVRVSFLEIYNEELIDLLGAESVENPRLRIYEDASRKGSCVIQGLEEVVVRNKNEVYDIMKRGAARRQTAATLMNAHSSRSHVLFMVTIHTKENSVDGEELLKTGKLNLVDLAGSECIGRSGAVDKRAREAGQINQSLLTLGRVISALVEHAPHIPYRESKLTRLLQDSLGGRTKTSIIATISPASSNLEETLSTLDYAYRAKNIQNKPELNQKLTKKALLKEYNEEIERMRRDLQAARDKNGIFMAQENYDAMHTQIAQQTDTIKELSDQIDSVTAEMEKLNDLFSETKEELIETKGELEQTSKNLKETKGTLKVTQVNLYKTTRDRDEQKHLVGAHVKNETKLYEQASQLKYTSEEATSDVGALQDKLDRKRKVEQTNDTVQETFRKRFRDNIDGMQKNLRDHTELNISKLGDSNSFLESIRKLREEETSHLTSSLTSVISDISQRIDSSVSNFTSQTEGAKESVQKMKELIVKSRDEELCRQFDFQEQTFETGMTTVEGQLNSIKTDLSSLAVSIETVFQAHKVGMFKFVDEQSEYLTKQQQLLDEFMQSQTESHQMEIDHVSTSLESQKTLNQTLADDFLGNVQQWVKDMLTKQHDHLSGNIEKSKAQLTSNKESVDKFHSVATTGTKTMRSLAKANLETTHKQYDDDKAETQKSIDAIKTEVGAGMHTKTEIQKSVAVFSEETRRLCTERSDNVCDLIDGHMKVLTEHMETNVTAVKELETTEEKAISTLATKQEADLKSLGGSIVSQTETQDAHGKAVQSWSDSVNKELESRDSEMERFLSDELQKDQPTGKTPQRRDFTYPRTLSKTDRHSTLLTEFRKDYTNDEALNIPVSDDSFASLISQPPPVMELDDEMEEGSEQAADSQDEDIQNSSSDSAFSSASTVSSVIDNNSKNVSLDKKLSRSTNSLNSHLSKNLSESKENISMKPPSGVPKTRQPSTKSHRTPSKTPGSKNPTPGAKSKTGSTTKSNTPNAAAPKAKTKLPLRSSNP